MLHYRPLGTALALALAVAASPLAAQTTTPDTAQTPAAAPVDENPVAARVNGEEIRLSEVMSMIKDLPPQYQQIPISALYPLLVRRAVNNKLMLVEARKTDIADDAALKAEVEAFRESKILEFYLISQIESQMTEDALRARYDEYVKTAEPEPSVKARHILLKTEEEANAVITELKGGADFAELAKQKSTGPSGPQGGNLGFFSEGQMVAEFEKAAFVMEPGTFSQTPVKTEFGWHVIKVEERREHPSFEEKQEDLRREMSGEVLTALVDDLRGDAEIEEFQIDGSPLPAADAPAEAPKE
ncbi:peptidylprolyl isomerase [Minwuia sp.]|uniref:peptidylprolyl isomerase n=1 Tax=Minwuia sp. TaxID=2493630 RepID=UPI003A935BC0